MAGLRFVSPAITDTATSEDVRQFQLAQSVAGIPVPTMNTVVSAFRFFFSNTLDRPDLARELVRVSGLRNLPVVLSRDEAARPGAGLRVGEVAMLKMRDIDSERMLIRVERGKGGPYRNAMPGPVYARANRLTDCGERPKVRTNARRIRSASPKPVSSAIRSIDLWDNCTSSCASSRRSRSIALDGADPVSIPAIQVGLAISRKRTVPFGSTPRPRRGGEKTVRV